MLHILWIFFIFDLPVTTSDIIVVHVIYILILSQSSFFSTDIKYVPISYYVKINEKMSCISEVAIKMSLKTCKDYDKRQLRQNLFIKMFNKKCSNKRYVIIYKRCYHNRQRKRAARFYFNSLSLDVGWYITKVLSITSRQHGTRQLPSTNNFDLEAAPPGVILFT